MKIEIQGLEALAAELGVTVEYLWAVLLKQAPISAAIDLAFVCFIVACCVAVFRCRKRIIDACDDNAGLAFLSTGGIVVLGILAIGSAFVAANLLTPLLHPEYWALKEVLSAVRK